MRLTKAPSQEESRIIQRFESLRRLLTTARYAPHLNKPLAYWALPNDRRLPLALMGRKLDELLSKPFSELSSTPGIGRKKMSSLLTLLDRAAETDPTELPSPDDAATSEPKHLGNGNGNGHGNGQSLGNGHDHVEVDSGFNASEVSEVVWSRWQACIVRHGLEHETLGRFAPSLRNLTRVIWNTPLGEYTQATLADIRSRKTHGEKRVRAILEVFHCVNEMVGQMGALPHLTVRIVPRQIDRVERWVAQARQSSELPTEEDLFTEFTTPLLEQVRQDAPQQIVALAENRLGLAGPITSIRQAARTLGLTRARVYQLLNEINDIVAVRWPTGRHQVYQLREKLDTESLQHRDAPDLSSFLAAVELFYPGNRRGADGPIEPATPAEKGGRALTARKPR